jgi:hypothetical protein
MYPLIGKQPSHKLAHYFSHNETLRGSLFSLEQDSLSLLFLVVLLLWCVVNAYSWSIYRRRKSKLLYMHENTCHLASMQNTKCPSCTLLLAIYHIHLSFVFLAMHAPQHVSLMHFATCYHIHLSFFFM